jgi:hypothetical protein
MIGRRIGYGAGPTPLMKAIRAVITRQQKSGSMPPKLVQSVKVGFLNATA